MATLLQEPTSPVVVLVPGAWHTGQVYDLLISSIREKGYEPFPIQLPSVGVSPGLPDFAADVAAIRSHVTKITDQDNRDVVLVMHSYSAIPGTEAMSGLAKKEREAAGKKAGVVALVYITSILPAKGFGSASTLECKTEEERAQSNTLKLRFNADGTSSVENPIEAFYHDAASSVAEAAAKQTQTHSSGTFGSPLTYEAYRDITSGYLLCELDKALPVSFQKRLADTAGIEIQKTIESAHSPFLTHPHQVADFIMHVAEKASQA